MGEVVRVKRAESGDWEADFRGRLEALDRSEVTIRHYINDVSLFRRWYEETYGEEFRPEVIVQREVREYRTWLKQSGASGAAGAGPGGPRGASASTVNRRLAAIGAYFRSIGGENPAAGVEGIRQAPGAVKALSEQQLRRVMREVHKAGRLRDIALLEVLAGTGIRVGELVKLEVADVVIRERSGSLEVRFGKGGSARQVPLNSDVRKALGAWIEVKPEGEALWIGERGPLTACGVWRMVQKYGEKAGIEGLTVHQFRHTALTRLIQEAGLDLPTVAGISGHSDIRTLLRYTRPTAERMQEAVEKLALGGD